MTNNKEERSFNQHEPSLSDYETFLQRVQACRMFQSDTFLVLDAPKERQLLADHVFVDIVTRSEAKHAGSMEVIFKKGTKIPTHLVIPKKDTRIVIDQATDNTPLKQVGEKTSHVHRLLGLQINEDDELIHFTLPQFQDDKFSTIAKSIKLSKSTTTPKFTKRETPAKSEINPLELPRLAQLELNGSEDLEITLSKGQEYLTTNHPLIMRLRQLNTDDGSLLQARANDAATEMSYWNIPPNGIFEHIFIMILKIQHLGMPELEIYNKLKMLDEGLQEARKFYNGKTTNEIIQALRNQKTDWISYLHQKQSDIRYVPHKLYELATSEEYWTGTGLFSIRSEGNELNRWLNSVDNDWPNRNESGVAPGHRRMAGHRRAPGHRPEGRGEHISGYHKNW